MKTLLKKPLLNYLYLIQDIHDYINIENYLKEEEIGSFDLILYYLLWSIEKGNLCIDLHYQELYDIFKSECLQENLENNINDFINIINYLNQANPEFTKVFVFYKNQYLFFKKHFDAQLTIKKIITTIINHPNSRMEVLEKNLQNIQNYLSKLQRIDEIQKKAIILSLLQNFFIITGGPGTGKTTIASHIIGLHLYTGIPAHRIAITAPTGRASSRLLESIKSNLNDIISLEKLSSLEPKTLHRLLQFKPSTNKFFYGEENQLPYDLILIDESSMIDIFLMKQFLLSFPIYTSKLIFIGDKNQLPSVNEGNIFSDLIPEDKIFSIDKNIKEFLLKLSIKTNKNLHPFYVELKTSYRSVKEIKELADSIINNDPSYSKILNTAKANNFDFFSKTKKIEWMEETKQEIIKSILIDYVKNKIIQPSSIYLKEISHQSKDHWDLSFNNNNPIHRLYDIITNYKILALTNVGFFGTQNIHSILLNYFYNDIISDGIPIIITRNDYYNELYNGDTGIILKDNENRFFACFKGKEQYILYSFLSLSYYDYSYSITVHKSQGSEYNEVLLLLPKIDNEEIENHIKYLLNQQILYTAFTRAKEKLYIIGSKDALEKGIRNKIKRISGISIWEEL